MQTKIEYTGGFDLGPFVMPFRPWSPLPWTATLAGLHEETTSYLEHFPDPSSMDLGI